LLFGWIQETKNKNLRKFQMKQLLLIFLLVTMILSCKKQSDNFYTIAGLLLDWDTQMPITNTKIYVSINPFSMPEDSAVTNMNGKAVFTLKDDGEGRMIYSRKDGFIFSSPPSHSQGPVYQQEDSAV
jgi:hypothetical protein